MRSSGIAGSAGSDGISGGRLGTYRGSARCQSPDIRFVIRQRKVYTPRPVPQVLPLPEREWWEDQPEFLNDKDDL